MIKLALNFDLYHKPRFDNLFIVVSRIYSINLFNTLKNIVLF